MNPGESDCGCSYLPTLSDHLVEPLRINEDINNDGHNISDTSVCISRCCNERNDMEICVEEAHLQYWSARNHAYKPWFHLHRPCKANNLRFKPNV